MLEIQSLGSKDQKAYDAFFLRGVSEQSDCFRITAADIAASPSPVLRQETENFTLGAVAKNGELRGVVSFERDHRSKMRHKGLIYRMYVHAGAAGQGVGTQLLTALLSRARAQEGLEQVWLTVVASNLRAKRLYSKFGFTTFALEHHALKWENRYFDEEQMMLSLK